MCGSVVDIQFPTA